MRPARSGQQGCHRLQGRLPATESWPLPPTRKAACRVRRRPEKRVDLCVKDAVKQSDREQRPALDEGEKKRSKGPDGSVPPVSAGSAPVAPALPQNLQLVPSTVAADSAIGSMQGPAKDEGSAAFITAPLSQLRLPVGENGGNALSLVGASPAAGMAEESKAVRQQGAAGESALAASQVHPGVVQPVSGLRSHEIGASNAARAGARATTPQVERGEPEKEQETSEQGGGVAPAAVAVSAAEPLATIAGSGAGLPQGAGEDGVANGMRAAAMGSVAAKKGAPGTAKTLSESKENVSATAQVVPQVVSSEKSAATVAAPVASATAEVHAAGLPLAAATMATSLPAAHGTGIERALPSSPAAAAATVGLPVQTETAGGVSLIDPGEVRTLSATPQRLEVGVATDTHGWLRLRAEMGSGGEVTASVVASSSNAAQAFHRELPALSEYLSHEQVGVASIAVSTAPVISPEGGTGVAGNGAADGAGQGSSQAQPGRQESQSSQAADEVAGPEPVPDFWRGGELTSASGVTLPSPLYGLGGGWVNVRV